MRWMIVILGLLLAGTASAHGYEERYWLQRERQEQLMAERYWANRAAAHGGHHGYYRDYAAPRPNPPVVYPAPQYPRYYPPPPPVVDIRGSFPIGAGGRVYFDLPILLGR